MHIIHYMKVLNLQSHFPRRRLSGFVDLWLPCVSYCSLLNWRRPLSPREGALSGLGGAVSTHASCCSQSWAGQLLLDRCTLRWRFAWTANRCTAGLLHSFACGLFERLGVESAPILSLHSLLQGWTGLLWACHWAAADPCPLADAALAEVCCRVLLSFAEMRPAACQPASMAIAFASTAIQTPSTFRKDEPLLNAKLLKTLPHPGQKPSSRMVGADTWALATVGQAEISQPDSTSRVLRQLFAGQPRERPEASQQDGGGRNVGTGSCRADVAPADGGPAGKPDGLPVAGCRGGASHSAGERV